MIQCLFLIHTGNRDYDNQSSLSSRCTQVHQLSTAYKEFKVVWVMAFNTTFNNISVISWRSVLLVEETGVLVDGILWKESLKRDGQQFYQYQQNEQQSLNSDDQQFYQYNVKQ